MRQRYEKLEMKDLPSVGQGSFSFTSSDEDEDNDNDMDENDNDDSDIDNSGAQHTSFEHVSLPVFPQSITTLQTIRI